MSKFSLDVLNRLVYPYFKSDDPDVVLDASFGEDVALTRIGESLLVSHLDPIVGAVKKIGWLAMHVACNDIATSGAAPRWAQVLVLIPHKEDETLLEEVMQDVAQAAKETGVAVIGGHTGFSANLIRPLVAVTAFGILKAQEPVLTRGAQPGDHVLVSKGIPLEGTAILASDFSQTAFTLGLTQEDLDEAKALMNHVSVIQEALLLAKNGATAMHDVTRGGLLEAILEIASLSDVGISIEYAKIPIPKVGQRFSEAFQFDPLKMISSGTLVATVSPDKIDQAKGSLKNADIPFADVGRVTTGQGVKIVREAYLTHHLEIHPEDDELARMWLEHQPDKAG